MTPARRTPLIGLTGAVAAGKSTALDALERLGAVTVSTDAIVHELLGSERVRELLVERWGPEVAPHGAVDRARVGELVFEQPDELAWLERTLHPLVGERLVAWRAGLPDDARLAVVEVPLLFEAGMDAVFDATICVVAPEGVRSKRAGDRGTAALEGRTSRQLSQEEKAARADYVVSNDGSPEELEAELERLLPRLAGRAEDER